MKKLHLLRLAAILFVIVMISSFAIVPKDAPWYYNIILFNLGLWPWLFAKNELKKLRPKSEVKVRETKSNWLNITGAILILIGALSIFPKNDTYLHTTLQITFIVGCLLFVLGAYLKNNIEKTAQSD